MALFSSPNYQPAINQAAKTANTIKKNTKTAEGYIDTSVGQAQPYFEENMGLFNDYIDQGAGARAMYLNSLGLGGEEGNLAAKNAFEYNPSHEIAQEAILRNNAALGGVASGNTMGDLLNLGYQTYGDWQNRLAGLDPAQAMQQKSAGLRSLGELFTNAGTNKANIRMGANAPLLGASNQLTSLMGQNAEGRAAANNRLTELLVQGGLNLAGGLFGA